MDWVTAVHACVDLHESYLQGAKGKLGERLTFCSKLEDIDVEITTIIGDGDFIIINIFNITHTGMKNIGEIYRKYDKMIFEFKNRYVKFINPSCILAYLGQRGYGRKTKSGDITVKTNALNTIS